MVAWKNQREHYQGQGIPGPLSGRPGTDSTSYFPGALHDFDRSRTWLLVPAISHRQHVTSRDPTYVDESRGAAVAS